MKRFFKILIFLLLLMAVYQYRVPLGGQLAPLLNNFSAFFAPTPCTEPIPYTLGAFDTQFNISKDYFLGALADAEAIWEKPYGKNLFIYAPTNSDKNVLKINLIYDYRQQATGKLADLGIVVKDDRASYDMLKAKFTALQTEYTTEKSAYDTKLADFNQREATYNTEVQSWNKKGGAPQIEYNKVETERLALEALQTELQNTLIQINKIVDEINALAVELNRLVAVLNLSVQKYNTVNTARGESFEEGVYMSDGSNRQIDIYEFSNRAKLVRVLAHELGHALNLDHISDPKAIMYELNQGNSQALTETDLNALKIKCGVK